jgi:hypothetical protein
MDALMRVLEQMKQNLGALESATGEPTTKKKAKDRS